MLEFVLVLTWGGFTELLLRCVSDPSSVCCCYLTDRDIRVGVLFAQTARLFGHLAVEATVNPQQQHGRICTLIYEMLMHGKHLCDVRKSETWSCTFVGGDPSPSPQWAAHSFSWLDWWAGRLSRRFLRSKFGDLISKIVINRLNRKIWAIKC